MIKGLAIAARVLHRPDLADAAAAAVDFIRHNLWRDGRLLATYKDGRAHLPAYLDDYAFLADALLELLQTRWRSSDLEFARQLAEVLLAQFEDADAGGFFFTARRSRATHSSQQDLQRRIGPVGQWRRGIRAVPAGISARRAALSGCRRAHAARGLARCCSNTPRRT